MTHFGNSATMHIVLFDKDGFVERGGHRVSLRKLSERGSLTHGECSDVMRQNYIDMALCEPPLVDVEGDEIRITDAGRRALPPAQSEPSQGDIVCPGCGAAKEADLTVCWPCHRLLKQFDGSLTEWLKTIRRAH